MTTTAMPTTQIVDVRTISPDDAQAMLDQPASNRPINKNRVASYADDMREGRWKPAASMIATDPDGNLLDGQHRLRAIVVSGEPQSFIFAVLPADTQDVMDAGRARQASDQMHIAGVKHATSVAAACRTLLTYPKVANIRTLSTPLILEFLDENPMVATYVTRIQKLRGNYTPKGWPSTAHMAAALAISPTSYHAQIESLFHQVCTMDADHDAARLYLRWLHRTSLEIGGGSHGTRRRWNALARTINAYVDDEPIGKLFVPADKTIRLAHERRQYKVREA